MGKKSFITAVVMTCTVALFSFIQLANSAPTPAATGDTIVKPGSSKKGPKKPKKKCSAKEFRSYARAVYERPTVSKKALRKLDRIRGCIGKKWPLEYQKKLGEKRWERIHPWSYTTASWFSPNESTGIPACGMGWLANGVAHKTLRCGTRLRICALNCVTAVVADRGPYVGSRELDLMPGTKNATGCGDLCSVKWRIGSR